MVGGGGSPRRGGGGPPDRRRRRQGPMVAAGCARQALTRPAEAAASADSRSGGEPPDRWRRRRPDSTGRPVGSGGPPAARAEGSGGGGCGRRRQGPMVAAELLTSKKNQKPGVSMPSHSKRSAPYPSTAGTTTNPGSTEVVRTRAQAHRRTQAKSKTVVSGVPLLKTAYHPPSTHSRCASPTSP